MWWATRKHPYHGCGGDHAWTVRYCTQKTLKELAASRLCCVPLLDSTRGLVNAAAFAAMKPNAVLIDVSRGGVVEEAALREGRIKGAALDVFATEPLPPDHPLWDMANVIVTPHCSLRLYRLGQQIRRNVPGQSRALPARRETRECGRSGAGLLNMRDTR
jgi:phosphoglycerate dehydrogenase-like enzyme